ncbi:DUF4136 domain-containing protein [Pseudomonas lalucatii]|uniref:DUF4136 domain-containing protein n=1 Tax=Pseudomonas lalucatii TaxID=1424203 RepID=A0ABS5Q0V2_9PSED|nr:DUF4136 domain-containing protein [Pseudomonas lalucatii]MBS7662150.1 DUF4136 domain-containing protein [Pseudomonas lalucatii]MBS7690444.1 DUF4136 domain-containing protein [Pseudomonas lalucatii]MBS7726082.1 DUF4136 domain-containing protein [Pseudomonas lalucatii]QVM88348.1 DUF4136 domain-containing protein [Pseudomonas lalucatii]
MRPYLLLIPALLLLAACQTSRLDRDFDPQRDFAAYRSWSWQEPAVRYRPEDPRLASDLTEQRLRTAIAEQLEQRGLRAAAAGANGDLRVQAWLIVDQRQQQVSTHYGGAWHGHWGGFWGGPGYVETRTVDYRVGTLQIDLFDGRDGQLVWRGSAAQSLRDDSPSPAERAAALHRTVAEVLGQYPPH